MRVAWTSMSLTLMVVSCKAKYGTIDQTPEYPSEDTEDAGQFDLGPVVTCTEPTDGFDRFTASGSLRGLSGPFDNDPTSRACMAIPGGVSAHDLNGDGYPELAFHQTDDFPLVYCNNKNGGDLATTKNW